MNIDQTAAGRKWTSATPLMSQQGPTFQQQRTYNEAMNHLQAQDDEIHNKCLLCCCLSTILCFSGPCMLHEYFCGE